MPDAGDAHHAGTAIPGTPGEVAATYARAGMLVFPCRPDKTPHVRWKEEATTDVEVIEAWWARWPDAMIGLPTGDGLAVIDLDVDKVTGYALGEETAERLGLRPVIESGLLVRTPSGGLHAWFAGDLPTTSGRIGKGVDTRGIGGYVIAPGSRNRIGAYVWVGPGLPDARPPALPPEIAAAVSGKPAARDFVFDAGPIRGAEAAGDAEVEEILTWIDPDAGGYQQWLDVLMGLHDHFGGSEAGVRIADAWSSRGAKYMPGEVPRKWQSFAAGGGITFGTVCDLARRSGADLPAIRRRHREPGVRQRAARGEPPGEEADPTMPPMRFLDYDAMRAMPEPSWIVDGVLQERTAALMFGKSNTFKSFLAIDLALSVATG